MSITIELNPQDEARLIAAAKAEGVDSAAIVQQLIHNYLPQPKAVINRAPDAENQRAIDLLRSWREEDATDDEEELERRDRENAELMQNLEANRLRLRMPGIDF